MKLRMLMVALAAAVLFSSAETRAAVTAPKVYVEVRVADDCKEMGKVSGGNRQVAVGSKLTVKATADKGFAFSYWTKDGDPASGAASYSYKVDAPVTLEAHFVAAEDDYLYVGTDEGESYEFAVEEKLELEYPLFYVESRSACSVKVGGLPSGVAYDLVPYDEGMSAVYLSGAPKKQGFYWVTCSVKNGNGYQDSAVVKLTVGYPQETDYDDIGLGDAVSFLDELATGHEVSSAQQYSDDGDDALSNVKSVTGLPAGLKFSPAACYYQPDGPISCFSPTISGIPTKAGKYTITFKDRFNRKTVKTVVVRDSGSGYLEVRSGDCGYQGKGTVTGSGVYAYGSKVKLSAKPAHNCHFAGWYSDEDLETPYCMGSGDYRKASDTLDFSHLLDCWYYDGCGYLDPPDCIYAKFVTKEEDAHPEIWCDDEWQTDEYCWFSVGCRSETLPKLTVKGVPAGITFDGGNGSGELYVSDQNKLKPGVYRVTFTLTNQSGAKVQKDVTVRVPNLQDDIFDGLEYKEDYVLERGVSDACVEGWCCFSVEPGWTVKASGLPSGLKFEMDDSYGLICGTPTKAGAYTVTLTAKRGSETRKATVSFVVKELPSYVVGKFNGVLTSPVYGDEDADEGDCIGTFSLTATEAGKLSVALALYDGTKRSYSANAWNCSDDGTYFASFYKKVNGGCVEEEEVFFEVSPHMDWDSCQLTGEFWLDPCRVGGEGNIRAQRNPFGKIGKTEYDVYEAHQIAATLNGYGKMPAYAFETICSEDGMTYFDIGCPNCVYPAPGGPTMTFTVGQDGKVKAAGKMGAYKISASSVLRIEYDAGTGEERPVADFCPYVNKTPLWIHVEFSLGYGANGAVNGRCRVGW